MRVPQDSISRFRSRVDSGEYIYRGRFDSRVPGAMCAACAAILGTKYPHYYMECSNVEFTGLLLCDECQRIMEGRATCAQ